MPPSDTAAAPSSARLVAESAFSVAATTAPDTAGTTVVIVRRKKLAVDGDHDDSSHEGDEATRLPKVYRVDARSPEESDASAAERDGADNSRGGASQGQDARVVGSRRRRHRKHGGVTIVRPAPPTASELADRTRMAKEQYERLKDEIRKLDRQIEAAREVEVGKAVRWIREAMDEYGLDAKDLGLA